MFKKLLIFLFLVSYLLLLATPVFAYGENCIENQGPKICRVSKSDNFTVCPDDRPICRCPSGLGPVECSAEVKSFDDCAAFEDRTWVGTFRTCMNLGEALNTVIQWAIILAGAAALGRLVIGGIQYIMSSGDPKSIQNARETLTSAIIGLILVVSAWLIANTLSSGFEEYGLPIKFTELIFGP